MSLAAAIITTITFQNAIIPPGGVSQQQRVNM